ncbi:MAG: flavodoxin family protein [Thermosulfidibacteraceae bacterium]|jgi:multimeric flavodoxin WrbA
MVILVTASPRRGSNSRILAERLLEEIGQEGIVFDLYKQNINFCIACNRCFENLRCFQEDDANRFFEYLERANLLIVASPVYFYGPPAPLKALIDRSQVYWYRKFILKEKLRKIKGIVVNTASGEDPKIFEPIEKITRVWLNSLNVKVEKYFKFDKLEEEWEVKRRKDYLMEVTLEGKKIRSLQTSRDR